MRPHPPKGLLFLLVVGLSLSAATGLGAQEDAKPSAAPAPAPAPRVAAPDESELTPVPVPEASPLAMQYYRTGMNWWAFRQLWGLLVPLAIAFSGLSARMRDLARRFGRRWYPTFAIYMILYLGLVFLVDLPFLYYLGYVRQHAYGLSNQTFAKWATDSALGLAVTTVGVLMFAWVPLRLMMRSPRRWWLYLSVLSVPFLLFLMMIMPVWIDPLFNDFGPMKDKALERSILGLASRAGIEGSRVFEVDKSVDTKAVNAYVTGFLDTKRIVLWDTLIARLEEKELLFVMAHEMGHYVLGHVVRSIVLSSVITLLGLFLLDRVGRRMVARFGVRLGFDRISDIAAVPLLILLLQAGDLVLGPAAMAYSRYQEHEADRFALDLTRTNRSGATAFVKLQQENLGNPRPGPVYRIFRASHPSIGERIDFCNSYRPADPAPAGGRPLGEP